MLKFSKMKSGAHKNEIMDTLRRIVKTLPAYKELAYFVKIVREHYLTDFEKSPRTLLSDGNLSETESASGCLACGACLKRCPQKINIPEGVKKISHTKYILFEHGKRYYICI